ncbi:hypothetical protein RCL1_006265 [Eukaryota sp. TZLM3-RCL]
MDLSHLEASYPPKLAPEKNYLELPSTKNDKSLTRQQKLQNCHDYLQEIHSSRKNHSTPTSAAFTGNERSPSRERFLNIQKDVLQDRLQYTNQPHSPRNKPLVIKSGLQLRPPTYLPSTLPPSSQTPTKPSPSRSLLDGPAGNYRSPAVKEASPMGKGRVMNRFHANSDIEYIQHEKVNRMEQYRSELDTTSQQKPRISRDGADVAPVVLKPYNASRYSSTQDRLFGPSLTSQYVEVKASPRNYKRLFNMYH